MKQISEIKLFPSKLPNGSAQSPEYFITLCLDVICELPWRWICLHNTLFHLKHFYFSWKWHKYYLSLSLRWVLYWREGMHTQKAVTSVLQKNISRCFCFSPKHTRRVQQGYSTSVSYSLHWHFSVWTCLLNFFMQ